MLRDTVINTSLYNKLSAFYLTLKNHPSMTDDDRILIAKLQVQVIDINSAENTEILEGKPETRETIIRYIQLGKEFHNLEHKLSKNAKKYLETSEEYKDLLQLFKNIKVKTQSLSAVAHFDHMSMAHLFAKLQLKMGEFNVSHHDKDDPKYIALTRLLSFLNQVYVQMTDKSEISWGKLIDQLANEITPLKNPDEIFQETRQLFEENYEKEKLLVSRSHSTLFGNTTKLKPNEVMHPSVLAPIKYYVNQVKMDIANINLNKQGRSQFVKLEDSLTEFESRLKNGIPIQAALPLLSDLEREISDIYFTDERIRPIWNKQYINIKRTLESIKKMHEINDQPLFNPRNRGE